MLTFVQGYWWPYICPGVIHILHIRRDFWLWVWFMALFNFALSSLQGLQRVWARISVLHRDHVSYLCYPINESRPYKTSLLFLSLHTRILFACFTLRVHTACFTFACLFFFVLHEQKQIDNYGMATWCMSEITVDYSCTVLNHIQRNVRRRSPRMRRANTMSLGWLKANQMHYRVVHIALKL
jgi:hypothetical protein